MNIDKKTTVSESEQENNVQTVEEEKKQGRQKTPSRIYIKTGV